MDKLIRVRRQKLIIGVVVLLFAGINSAWSITNAPFRMTGAVDGIDAVLNYTQLGLNYTMYTLFFCLGSVCTGLISKQTSATLRLVLSALLIFSSYTVSSLLIVTLPVTRNYFMLYMAYGLLGGLGIGMAYNTVISTVNMWFPDKRGFCSGVLMMGFGLSLLILGRLTDIMGRSELLGWRGTYLAIAITLGVIFIIAAIFIKPPPKGAIFPPPKGSENNRAAGEPRDYTTLEMIKRPSFTLIFLYCTILASLGTATIGFACDIAVEAGATASFAVTAAGFLGLFNGIGRFVSGWLFDNHGIRKTQLISSAVAILAPLTVVSALAGNSMALGLIGLCLCGLTFGFAPTTSSVFAAEFYGKKNFSLNFGIFALMLVPASFATTLAGSIRTSTGGFTTVFIILAALSVVAFLLNLGIRKP